ADARDLPRSAPAEAPARARAPQAAPLLAPESAETAERTLAAKADAFATYSSRSDNSSVRDGLQAGRRGRARAALPGEKRNVPAPGKSSASPAGRKTVRVTLAPMTGRAVDARHLILYRTVLRGSLGYRQGLVIDMPRLGDWLQTRAVGSTGLEGLAALRFDSVFDPEPPAESRAEPDAEFAYRRRFAEPFAALGATLELQALPGLGGESYVIALSVLLVAAGALGLIALYRMVSVALRFAERRSNFAAAVSHELKTPLTAIRMYAEMLRDDMVDSDEKRHEYYEAMTNESERLSRLIHNVLEFSQLEKGQRELTPQVGSLEPVLRETERLLRAHVEREGFTLQVDVAPGLPAVRFDHDALLQVLFNLVDNAIKYASASEDKRISLCCEPDGDGVRLSVRDFGPGVASRQLQRVFEPFYREEAELTRRTKGTGIGLALVRGLVDAMGGDVSAENAEPTGLRVRIRLRPASA
ncbi:MAG: HAMP domain-containing histidine kinase, partial [Deltaproteobacteria bacterium]|nr:HAMP domain-containing histidine kinase [Deltaproteobacteria bacterium]